MSDTKGFDMTQKHITGIIRVKPILMSEKEAQGLHDVMLEAGRRYVKRLYSDTVKKKNTVK